MAILTLHRKQRFKVTIPYWMFIDGQPVGMMCSGDVGIDLPEGSYNLAVMIQQVEFSLREKRRGFHLVIGEILQHLPQPLPETGLLNLFVKHTSIVTTVVPELL